jgi:predicted SAM-dependent methyltransferase
MGRDVNFAPMSAERTEFEDATFDLIVSHILLHETSFRAMPRIFRECHRLLKPGGYMIHADLPPFDTMDDRVDAMERVGQRHGIDFATEIDALQFDQAALDARERLKQVVETCAKE